MRPAAALALSSLRPLSRGLFSKACAAAWGPRRDISSFAPNLLESMQ